MSILIVCYFLIGCGVPEQPGPGDAPVVAVPAPRPDTGSVDFALLAWPMSEGALPADLEDTGQQIAPTIASARTEQ